MDAQDPKRKDIQHPIPADPAAAGEADKVVGENQPKRDPNTPSLRGVSSGEPIDHVGGAGLGKPPGEGGNDPTPSTRNDEPAARQDRTGHS